VIQKELRTLVREAIAHAHAAGELSSADSPVFTVEQPQRREHGDWTTNVAMVLAGREKKPPRELAETIIRHMPQRDWVREVEIAGRGFINLHLSNAWLHDTVARVLNSGGHFGATDEGAGTSVNVEFVSINPTGPLHIGSARNAVLGDCVARLLEFNGYGVTREYYFNDTGQQMTNFGLSVAAQYLKLLGRTAEIPEDGYKGAYVIEYARRILDEDGDRHQDVPFEELGEVMRERAVPLVKDAIRVSLERFRVHMDVWFNERDLYESGKVVEVIDMLDRAGYVYEHEGAKWLKATELGDSRDRVLVRSFGAKQPTYLVPDFAYHLDKASRADKLVIVLGADHHAQGSSLKAGMKVLGVDPERIEVLIYQWVHMLRSGEEQAMSKRAGTFESLDEFIDEVGVDAARYTLVRTSADNTLYFDVEEIKKQTLENPVYYVQYAHARIAGILRHAEEQGAATNGDVVWDELHEEAEVELMRAIANFEETVAISTDHRAPYRIAKYAEDLAKEFNQFYTQCRVVTDDEALTRARLALSRATKQVLANALSLLGVEAPDRMERSDSL
jgi:arginyl-tRNA synthetase